MLSSGTGLKGNVRATKVSWISTGFSKPSPVLKDRALKKKAISPKIDFKNSDSHLSKIQHRSE